MFMPFSSPLPNIVSGKKSRRLVATMILGIMAVMAGISLFLSLQSWQQRRAHDQKPLGYLPPDCNVIGALHVSKILQEEAGPEFLDQLSFGSTHFRIADLEYGTGLRREELIDVVFGWKVADLLMPRLTLVLQTRLPYKEAQILARLKEKQFVERDHKKMLRVQSEKTPFHAVLWFAGENTVVAGLSLEDLDAVPAIPRSGINHLPPPLQEFSTDEMTRTAHLWILGHSEHWDKTVLGSNLAQTLGLDQQSLNEVHTFGAWVRWDQRMIANAALQCTDEAKARDLESRLLRKGLGDKGRLYLEQNNWVKFAAQPSLPTFLQ